MVLVPFLGYCAPLGLMTKPHVAKSTNKDQEAQYQEDDRWHSAILCCGIPDTLLVHTQ
jgi:hypothetical protein